MYDLNDKRKGGICHDCTGEGDTGAGQDEELQTSTTLDNANNLTANLIEQICSANNMREAYKQVKRNKGAAGVDGMNVQDLKVHLKLHIHDIRKQLLDGTYKPQAVLGIKIPKPGGGERQLGIPTVVDRFVQQAILQVLHPIFDPTFSESSYGFRPKRSAHQALKAASSYVEQGRVWVVDMDLEKFFDRVNHDILMSKLAKRIADKRLLKLIRRYLQTGMLLDGVSTQREAGTPQGSPLSPLLSNIMLDELDKELEKRGHKFCRYADDCNIYVCSERAGYRIMKSITGLLEKRLQLKVNPLKSAVAKVDQRKFLGYRLETNGELSIAAESIKRIKEKIRQTTKRNRGCSIEKVIKELNQSLRGWLNYFRLCENARTLRSLDSWCRRKLRCYRLNQCKRARTITNWLMKMGVREKEATQIGSSGKGWWRLSRIPALHRALDNKWFKMQGLLNLEEMWLQRRVNT
jgi:RNA-directed DNA polymerase